MNKENITRFWDKYIDKTIFYGVKHEVSRWYVKHCEYYIKRHEPLRLAEHSPEVIHRYLQDLGRNIRLEAWQKIQVVEALRIMFVDIVKTDWASQFSWDGWRDSFIPLSDSHATIG